MIKTVKIGEIQTEMIGDISTVDVMNVLLRVGWGAETTSRIAFKPAEDLNTGDGIRITIEKVYEEPEPEEGKETATGEVVEAPEEEGVGEVLVDEVAETPAPETGGGEEGDAEKV